MMVRACEGQYSDILKGLNYYLLEVGSAFSYFTGIGLGNLEYRVLLFLYWEKAIILGC